MRQEGDQLLPSDDTAVFVNTRKLIRYLAKAVQYGVGKDIACKCLTSQEGWTVKQLNEVNCDRLQIALGKELDGNKTWLAKQHTDFCGTSVQVGYYSDNPTGDESCPNCGDKETAAHLCMCPNQDRQS